MIKQADVGVLLEIARIYLTRENYERIGDELDINDDELEALRQRLHDHLG